MTEDDTKALAAKIAAKLFTTAGGTEHADNLRLHIGERYLAGRGEENAARVIEKVIESAALLGRDDEARFYLLRYRAAFPESQARWAKENTRLLRASVLVQHGKEHQGAE